MDSEFVTRGFVLIGYAALAVNAGIILYRLHGHASWYRRVALWAIAAAATSWAMFYAALETGVMPATGIAAPLSRLAHTITIGAFAVQQFVILRATTAATVSAGLITDIAATIDQSDPDRRD